MGAHVHRPNGHNSRDDEGVRDRIARIVASRPKTLRAQSYMFVQCLCKLSQCLGAKCSPVHCGGCRRIANPLHNALTKIY